MKVIVCEPQKLCEIREIEETLETYQGIVGGNIQAAFPVLYEDIVLVCNDMGKVMQLPWNRPLYDEDNEMYDIIAGTFFLCGMDDENGKFISLTDEQIEKYVRIFNSYMAF